MQAIPKKCLPLSFYRKSDTVSVARGLLGKALLTEIDGCLTGGIIIETEAYTGICDRASHSYNNRRTARNEVMYEAGGIAYVYVCYGIHYLLNAITGEEGDPQGVLIRAIEPIWGIETMNLRRNKKQIDKTLSNGPGAVTQALGVTLKQRSMALNSSTLWIAESGVEVSPEKILAGPRIGIDYAGEDALLPYRFQIKKIGDICPRQVGIP